MPLQRQTVNLRLTGSVDERSDRKQVDPSAKMSALQDVDLSETGAIKKRRGYTALSGSHEGLLANGRQGVYTPIQEYNPTHGLLDKSDTHLQELCITDRRILRADSDSSYYWGHAAYSSNGRLYVSYVHDNPFYPNDEWRVACLDPATYEQLNSYEDETPLSVPTGTAAHLLARSNGVVVLYRDGNDLKVTASNDDATSWSSPATLEDFLFNPINDLATGVRFSVCQKDEETAWIVYEQVTTGARQCYEIDLIGLSAIPLSNDGGGSNSLLDIAYISTRDEVRVAQHNSTIGIEIWNPHTGATQVIDAAKTSGVENVAIGRGPTDGIVVYDYSDPSGSGDELKWLHIQAFNTSTLALITSHEAMGQHLESKIHNGQFVIKYNPQPGGSTTEQLKTPASRYLVECGLETGSAHRLQPIAAMSYSEALRRPANGTWLAPLVSDGADRLFWAGQNYVGFKLFEGHVANAGSATQTSMSLYAFDFAKHRVGYNIEAHGMQVLAGGLPLFYDGSGVSSLGILNAPVIGNVTTSNGSGALTNSATYQWVAVFEMADERGRRWLSQPSLPFEATLGGSDDTADVDIYLAISREDPARYVTRVILYRNTVARPSIFYRASRHVTSSPLSLRVDFNDKSTSVITVQDVLQDSDIEQNEVLYALPSGPVLEDYPPPPSITLAVHKRRLFAVHSETGDIWGSKLFVPGEGIRWTPAMAIQNPFPHERPTALISTEAALLVFYRSRVGRILGEGPNDLGQGAWSEIEFFPSNTVGAISQRCTEATPRGVFFVDERQGPMLLPYGGYPEPIGHDWPIASYDDDTIRGVDWLEDRDEVRFTFADGTYRALHVQTGSWTTGTISDQGVLQTAVWDQNHAVLLDNNTVVLEDTSGTYQTPSLTFETAWIKLADLPGIQGRFRLWDIYLIGEYVDTHNLTVRVSYDFDDADYYEVNFADAALSALNPYQLRVRPNRQQVQAVKVRVTETTPTTQGYKLSQLRLDFGVQPSRKVWARPGGAA